MVGMRLMGGGKNVSCDFGGGGGKLKFPGKAKISENLRKTANLAPLVPFSLSLLISPEKIQPEVFLTEVFSRTSAWHVRAKMLGFAGFGEPDRISAGTPGRKLPLWADFWDVVFFAYSWKLPAYRLTVELFYLQLTVLVFFLTI